MTYLLLGQILEYCLALFESDKGRGHLYVLLTDLNRCRLFHVTSDYKTLGAIAVKCTTIFKWYDSAKDNLVGLQVLRHLGNMTREQLGMNPVLEQVGHHHEVVNSLGEGASTRVYEVLGEPGKANIVFKLARNLEGASERLERERNVLTKLQLKLQASKSHDDTDPRFKVLNALDHFPRLRNIPGVKDSLLWLQPVGRALTCLHLLPQHVVHLMGALYLLHEQNIVHGDVSFHNMVLAPADWWTVDVSESTSSSNVLVLIDFDQSETVSEGGGARGTALTMSQDCLLAWCLASDASLQEQDQRAKNRWSQLKERFRYRKEDDLESAVKSVLLTAYPLMKRRLKQHHPARLPASNATMCFSVWQFWETVLPMDVRALCRALDYGGLVDWLTADNRLLFGPVSSSKEKGRVANSLIRRCLFLDLWRVFKSRASAEGITTF